MEKNIKISNERFIELSDVITKMKIKGFEKLGVVI